ncbi:MAG: hypothetical protein QOG65_1076 [Actinomycetota bacterium]|nr:hypothetical protein [Actinomycetota bacterium]
MTRHNKSNPEPVAAGDADDQGPAVSPTVDPYLVPRHRPNYDDAQTNQFHANATRQATQDSVVKSHGARLSHPLRRFGSACGDCVAFAGVGDDAGSDLS